MKRLGIVRERLGHLHVETYTQALKSALATCSIRPSLTSGERHACREGALILGDLLIKAEGVVRGESRPSKIGAGLGYFSECFAKCPEGFEKLVVRKGNPKKSDRGICVCRLAPGYRKKFREDVKPEAERRPYGSWKRPVHLRRRTREFAPGLHPRDIVPLR